MDGPGRMRRSLLWMVLFLWVTASGSGCVFMTKDGQAVVVERTTQTDLWDGNGMLVERTADGRHCKVKVRDSLGIVVSRWFDCEHVHRRMD